MAAPGTTGSHETSSSRVIRSFEVSCDPVVPGAAEISCDPVVPGAATRRDPTHQIKLLR